MKVEVNGASFSAQTAPVPSTQTQNTPVPDPKQSLPGQNSGVNPGLELAEYKKQNPTYTLSTAEKAIIDAIEHANKKLVGIKTEFEFSIHEKTKQISVKVMNAETKEVIREIPPEKVLDMVAKMWEMAGLFVDERK